MKPLVSLFVLLILFQSLLLGSLVKLDFPYQYPDNWQESLISKQVPLDPFLLPDNGGLLQNSLNKKDWSSNYFNNRFTGKKITEFPLIIELAFSPGSFGYYSSVPFFILNSTLRI